MKSNIPLLRLLFVFSIIYLPIILPGCQSTNDKSQEASNSLKPKDDDCDNGILGATIRPADLQAIIDTPDAKKIFLQFKTDNDKTFYPAAYTGKFPFYDVSSYFHTNLLQPLFYPDKPYILGNVEWKFPKGFHVNMSAQLYAIYPDMDDDNIHVTYNYLIIPYRFEYKDSTYLLDSTFFANLPKPQRIELLKYVAATATRDINPVPPKQP